MLPIRGRRPSIHPVCYRNPDHHRVKLPRVKVRARARVRVRIM